MPFSSSFGVMEVALAYFPEDNLFVYATASSSAALLLAFSAELI